MSVKLTVGAVASNKPPVPTPSEADYPVHLTFSDGREVWVSAPKPDRITLIAPLKPHHFIPQPEGEKQLDELVHKLSSWLAQSGGLADPVDTSYDKLTGLYKKLSLSVGDREARVFVEFVRPRKGANPKPWKLRLEFNPRKIGAKGLATLTTELSYAKSFRIDRFLADCRLTRLDVAVDFIGVAVWETVAAIATKGKRTFYVGDDGRIETLQLHRNNPAAKQTYTADGKPKKVARRTDPLGPVIAKLYDRVKERASVLQPPPFGPAPVTRAELVKRWKGNGPTLTAMREHKNLLTDLAVDYDAHEPPADLLLWQTYVAARRAMPKPAVNALMKLSIPRGIAFGKRYDHPASHLLQHEKVWSYWPSGLTGTGLDYWIALAEQAPFQTFEGGQL